MRIRPAHHPGAFYHVMLRGNRKQIIFRDDDDRQLLERLVARSLARYHGEVHTFCWMPNHLHLLVQVREVPVHRIVHYFATLYAQYFNVRYELVGPPVPGSLQVAICRFRRLFPATHPLYPSEPRGGGNGRACCQPVGGCAKAESLTRRVEPVDQDEL